jgi:hypothetical protein
VKLPHVEKHKSGGKQGSVDLQPEEGLCYTWLNDKRFELGDGEMQLEFL